MSVINIWQFCLFARYNYNIGLRDPNNMFLNTFICSLCISFFSWPKIIFFFTKWITSIFPWRPFKLSLQNPRCGDRKPLNVTQRGCYHPHRGDIFSWLLVSYSLTHVLHAEVTAPFYKNWLQLFSFSQEIHYLKTAKRRDESNIISCHTGSL